MTSRTTEQSARELQKVEGIPYAEALRRVTAGERSPEESAEAVLRASESVDFSSIEADHVAQARHWLDLQFGLLRAFEDADPSSTPAHSETELASWLRQTATPDALRAEVQRLLALEGVPEPIREEGRQWLRALDGQDDPLALHVILDSLSTEPHGDLILPTILHAPGAPLTDRSYRLGTYADGLGNSVSWTPMDGSVLLVVGGPGTGKSVLATTIAQQSRRTFVVTRHPREWEGVEVEAIHTVEPGVADSPVWRIGRGDLLVIDTGKIEDRGWVGRQVGRLHEYGHTLLLAVNRWDDVYGNIPELPEHTVVATLKEVDSTSPPRYRGGVVGTLSSAGAAFLVDRPYQPSSGLGEVP